ncbi:MAG: hypothetical protein ACLQQ4_04990 [Bacteroidia bacterium]
MNTSVRLALLFLVSIFVFTSCKTYQVTHYKSNDIGKIGKIESYTVYIHSKNGTFKVDKPSLTTSGVNGELTRITDQSKVEEIRNPVTRTQLKRHRHDLNLYTKTEIIDSSFSVLKKQDINDISITISKSPVNIGDIAGAVLVSGLGIAMIAGIVYAFEY